jgi:hypothetical protein
VKKKEIIQIIGSIIVKNVSLLLIFDVLLERIQALIMEELSHMKTMSILSLLSKRLSTLLHVMNVVSLLLTWP